MSNTQEIDEVLVGTPSDQVPEILSAGGGDVTAMFVSLSKRHPEGDDAAYLRWHALDHRPEQYRLHEARASLRAVSTPACRAARAFSDPQFDATDHVMTYFFTDPTGMGKFRDLAVALKAAGRMPYVLPAVQRAMCTVQSKTAAARVKVGADVLPWWPAKGIYLLIEPAVLEPAELASVQGVAGIWSGVPVENSNSTVKAGQQIAYLFLDGDPVETAKALRPVIEERSKSSGVQPRLAAPFYAVVPHEWDRYLP